MATELFDPRETVQIVVAKRPKWDDMVRRDFDLCKQQLLTGDRLVSLEFDTPHNSLPLQVADLVASVVSGRIEKRHLCSRNTLICKEADFRFAFKSETP